MAEPAEGVNLIGFFHAEFGQGEVARRLDAALHQAGIPHTTIPYERVPQRQEHAFEHAEGELHDVNVLCLNAEHLLGFVESPEGGLLEGRHSVGVWFWETNVFPEYLRPALKYLDGVWVASEFVAEAIRAVTAVPVTVFPLPVDPPPAPKVARADLGLPTDRFLFSFVFDFHSTAARKNPDGLIEAYRHAFGPEDGAALVVKSINGDKFPAELRRLEELAAERPDICVVDGFVPGDRIHAYTTLADCSVSLHRSEGFGLTLAEAMAAGKPVIATGYSGNLAFMDEENSYLVHYELTELPEDRGPYPAGSGWAEPAREHASELMRRVVEQSDEARARAEQGRETIAARNSLGRTAEFLREHMPERDDSIATPAERAARYLAQGPRLAWSMPTRLGGPGLLYRRLLLRLLRPYTARQRELEHTVVDGIRELELEVEALRRRVEELERQRGGS